MKREKQWYIVYTQTGKELKTLYCLTKKHFECFCPLTTSIVGTRNKTIESPLFPGYIFVHILPEECAAIRKIEGVINFMYWLDKPVIVADEDVFLLKDLVKKYKFLTAENIKVNRTLSTAKYWKPVPVATEEDSVEVDEELMTVSFPAYGFTVTAKESKVNVRVINVSVTKNRQRQVRQLLNLR